MRKAALAALLVFGLYGPAHSASYDDLNLGIQMWNNRKWTDAVAFFDKAIAAGDLVPGLRYVAYFDRADAHMNLRHAELAITDYTASLSLRPGDSLSLMARSKAYYRIGKLDDAVRDIDAILAAAPDDPALSVERAVLNAKRGQSEEKRGRNQNDQAKNTGLDGLPFILGLADWEMNNLQDIESDFSAGFSRQRNDAYPWLWLALVDVRAGKPVARRLPPAFNREDWPGPIVDLFLGEGTKEDVFAAASLAGGETLQGWTCEANFYVGEWLLWHHDPARPRLSSGKRRRSGPMDFIEWSPAMSELKNLP